MGRVGIAMAQMGNLSVESDAKVQSGTDKQEAAFGDKTAQGTHTNLISDTSLPNPAGTNGQCATSLLQGLQSGPSPMLQPLRSCRRLGWLDGHTKRNPVALAS